MSLKVGHFVFLLFLNFWCSLFVFSIVVTLLFSGNYYPRGDF